MTRFEAGDIVRVPFPYVESEVRRYRPAVVVSRGTLGPNGMLLWVAMVTNAQRPSWPGDVDIADHSRAGLPIPSKVRTCKLATLESGGAERIGRLDPNALEAVRKEIGRHLGLAD